MSNSSIENERAFNIWWYGTLSIIAVLMLAGFMWWGTVSCC